MDSKSYLSFSNAVSIIRGSMRNTFDNVVWLPERLRSAVLKAGATDVLRGMIGTEYESTYAGLHYLRAIARFGWLLLTPPNLLLTPLQMKLEVRFQVVKRWAWYLMW